ncbi:MAG: hypothetical protein QM784_07240 [Polyangiaceae bacterium]
MTAHGFDHRTAAWLCLIALYMATVDVAAATVDDATKAQLKDATAHYESGVKALDAGKHAEALTEFQKSYEIVNSPNSRLMVGRVLIKLERLPDAYRELELTLKQAKALATTQAKYQKTADAAQRELDELTKRISLVHIAQGTKVEVQGKPVDLSEWQRRVPVDAGKLDITLTFPDGQELKRSFQTKPGESIELNVLPESGTASAPTEERESSTATTAKVPSGSLDRRTVGYVVGGAGVLGLGAFVGFGLIGASSYGDPKSNCAAGACPESSVDDAGSKSLMQGIGYTGLAVGVLGLGIGTWLVLSGGSAEPSTAVHLAPGELRMIRRF